MRSRSGLFVAAVLVAVTQLSTRSEVLPPEGFAEFEWSACCHARDVLARARIQWTAHGGELEIVRWPARRGAPKGTSMRVRLSAEDIRRWRDDLSFQWEWPAVAASCEGEGEGARVTGRNLRTGAELFDVKSEGCYVGLRRAADVFPLLDFVPELLPAPPDRARSMFEAMQRVIVPALIQHERD